MKQETYTEHGRDFICRGEKTGIDTWKWEVESEGEILQSETMHKGDFAKPDPGNMDFRDLITEEQEDWLVHRARQWVDAEGGK